MQLYFYYAIKVLGFDDIIQDTTSLVLKSQNQVLVAYYLKDENFSEEQISSLKIMENEEYWFQNYHLILYTPSLNDNLDASIRKYLIPERLSHRPNPTKENRYYSFYYDNLHNRHAVIRDISSVTASIRDYLELRSQETMSEDNLDE